MKLGMAGLGWWGGTLVDAVAGTPPRFTAAYTRSRQDQAIAAKHDLKPVDSDEAMLADLEIHGVAVTDAIIASARSAQLEHVA